MKKIIIILFLFICIFSACSNDLPVYPINGNIVTRNIEYVETVTNGSYLANSIYTYNTNIKTTRQLEIYYTKDFGATWLIVPDYTKANGFAYFYDINKDYLGLDINVKITWNEVTN